MRRLVLAAMATISIAPGVSFGREKKRNEPVLPVVRIASPDGGQSVERKVQVLGTISDRAIRRATIVVNGTANPFDVREGRFAYLLYLAPGENLVQVVAANRAGAGSDSVCLYSRVPTRDVKVVMTWDTATDIDLHVVEPTQEEVFYSHKNSKIGGQLDHDDTDGFGPETYLLTNAVEGRYVVKVKYYGGSQGQTRVRIAVVLFEGTPVERRLEFTRLLMRRGEFVEVASFHVRR